MEQKKSWKLVIALTVLAVMLCIPALLWMASAWMVNEYYSHGPLVLAVSLFFTWIAWRQIKNAESRNLAGSTGGAANSQDNLQSSNPTGCPGRFKSNLVSWSGRVLLIVAAALYIVGMKQQHPTPVAYSLLFFISGFILHFRGTSAAPLLFPVSLLALAIPIPNLEVLGGWMQAISSSSSTWFVERLGQEVVLLRNVITIGGADYEIAITCSGLNKIMPLFTLVYIMTYCLKGSIYKKGLLFLLVIPLSIVTNVIRLSFTLLLGSAFGPQTAVGFYHSLSSLFFFLVAVSILGLTAHYLRLLQPRKEVFG